MDKQHGFTLIELLITLLLVGILVIVAVPSFINYVEKNRLIGTSQALYFALQEARTEAIKRNATVYVSLQTGNSWCYGINTGSACTCTTSSSCNLGAVQAPNSTTMSLSTTGVTSNTIHFEPNHGASGSSSTLTFTTIDNAAAISVTVGILGSIQICSGQITGYQACS